MRTLLTAGNWKMNGTVEDAIQLASSLRETLRPLRQVEVVVCPPFVALKPVQDVLRDSPIHLGAQDVFFEDRGAYTGAISAPMLAGLCRYVIVGHSERRHWFGDTDEWVAKKAASLERHEITPIVCVGETLEERDAGITAEVIGRQMNAVLQGMTPTIDMVVAYEPVWAIGTGRSANPRDVNATVAGIREMVRTGWGAVFSTSIRILYGGSVTSDNVESFVSLSEIDGTLVGGASLKCAEFTEIVARSASTCG